MKKFLFIVTAIVAVSLVGCESKSSYTAEGERLAKELDRLVELQDTAALLALNDSIMNLEAQIQAKNDTLALSQFRKALSEARQRTVPFIATVKMDQGENKDEVVKEMTQEALNGSIDIATITSAIDEMNKKSSDE